MRSDFPGEDPKAIWQNQPTEPSNMTLEKLRQKARELHAKTRRELVRNVGVGVSAMALSGVGILRAHDLALRLMFALAFAWAVAGQYFLHRGMWSATPPGDSALSTGLEFYRSEVERRRYLFRRVLRWTFGPLVLSIAALVLALMAIAWPRGLSARMIPFFTLLVVWTIAVVVIRRRGGRQLRQEIEELAEIERQSGR